ncbi:hypothetical protein ACM66B_004988 [Microbotryomycetes sp. NB124-2]
MAKPGFYAVQVGKRPGVYTNWPDAESQVRGFPGAKHKKFLTRDQAQAFVEQSLSSRTTNEPSNTGPKTSSKRGRAEEDDRSDGNGQRASSGKATDNNSRKRARPVDPVFNTRASTSRPGRTVYCDGSSRGNGQHGATAGIGVYWGHEQADLNLSERLPGTMQTNNRAEIYAVARILETDPTPDLPLTICTDSQYTISIFSEWVPGWRRKGWRTSSGKPVLNVDLIRYVLALLALRAPSEPRCNDSNHLTSNVTLVKVKAHVGIEGNEQADRLANEGALMPRAADVNFEELTRQCEQDLHSRRPGVNPDFAELSVVAKDLASRDELEEMGRTQSFD